MKKILLGVFLALLVVGAAGAFFIRGANGFSTRNAPTNLEAAVARRARLLAMSPADAETRNPMLLSPQVLTEARLHFADHCASCHANDGSGNTEIGRMLYPRVPDMRQPETQSLSDSQLYFVIHNGIRMSGMPGWGPSSGDDLESWALVHFIRHLPKLSQQEIDDMKAYNPKSPAEIQEEKNEEDFLNGKSQN